MNHPLFHFSFFFQYKQSSARLSAPPEQQTGANLVGPNVAAAPSPAAAAPAAAPAASANSFDSLFGDPVPPQQPQQQGSGAEMFGGQSLASNMQAEQKKKDDIMALFSSQPAPQPGYGGGYGVGYGAAIILVLFILLVIIIGARAFDRPNR